MLLLAATVFAQSSAETLRWAADARLQISRSWGSCVDNLSPNVPLPDPSYTTVAEGDVGPDGVPLDIRIVKASGSSALDACVVQAFRSSGRFPTPPAAMTTSSGKARLSEIVLTLNLASTPTPAPVTGPTIEATKVAGISAADVAKAPTRIASAVNGTRNVWCHGGDAPACDIRDARGSMLVFTTTVCVAGADLTLGTAYGPMRVAGGAELVPGVAACR
jgi:hypothetical protein